MKTELKRYDNEFTDLFSRPPNRSEKEIMRPIYLYYKNLKSTLDLKAKQNQNVSAANNMSNNSTGNNYGIGQNLIKNFQNKNLIDITTGNNQEIMNLGGNSKNPTAINNNNLNNPSIINNLSHKNRTNNIINTNNNPSTISTISSFNQANVNNQKITNNNFDREVINPNLNNIKNNTISNFSIETSSGLGAKKLNIENSINTNNYINNNNIINPPGNNYNFQNNSFTNQKDLKDKKTEIKYSEKDKNHKNNKDLGDRELDSILLANPINKRSNSHTHGYHQTLKDKKYSKSELIQLEKEYDLIKKDQVDLKQKLHNYQKEFYQQHNRKVKYYKDIIGMENEYQDYKENKLRIKQILEILEKYKLYSEKDF